MIPVLARITLHKGPRPAWLSAFRAIEPLVAGEDGCLGFEATVDTPGVLSAQSLAGEDTVIIVERWRDEASLRAHSTAPHMTACREALRPLVAGIGIAVLRPL